MYLMVAKEPFKSAHFTILRKTHGDPSELQAEIIMHAPMGDILLAIPQPRSSLNFGCFMPMFMSPSSNAVAAFMAAAASRHSVGCNLPLRARDTMDAANPSRATLRYNAVCHGPGEYGNMPVIREHRQCCRFCGTRTSW